MSRLRLVLAVIVAAGFVVLGLPATASRSGSDYTDPVGCSRLLADGDATMTRGQHRRCMRAIATTYLDGQQGRITPSRILFDPRAIRYPPAAP